MQKLALRSKGSWGRLLRLELTAKRECMILGISTPNPTQVRARFRARFFLGQFPNQGSSDLVKENKGKSCVGTMAEIPVPVKANEKNPGKWRRRERERERNRKRKRKRGSLLVSVPSKHHSRTTFNAVQPAQQAANQPAQQAASQPTATASVGHALAQVRASFAQEKFFSRKLAVP